MKETPSGGADPPETPNQVQFPMMVSVQFETMMAACLRTYERIGTINRIWLAAIQEANSTGADLAAHLMQCGNQAEGVGLYDKWIRERAARLASDSQQVAELWAGLYGAALEAPSAAADPYLNDEMAGPEGVTEPPSKAA